VPSGVYKRTAGKKLSEEHKKHISESHIGMIGKHHSAETKLKMSESRKGKKHSAETKQKIGKSHEGKKLSEEHKQRIGAANKISKKGKKFSENHKKHLSESHIGMTDRHHSTETKLKMSVVVKRKWQNIEYRKKMIKSIMSGATTSTPNKKEKQLLNILNNLFPNEYKFVGSGELIINGKVPDFVNTNGQKKIIELFGDYWHSEARVKKSKKKHEKERIDAFSPFGYQTLIIWEYELKNINVLTQKLGKFHVARKS